MFRIPFHVTRILLFSNPCHGGRLYLSIAILRRQHVGIYTCVPTSFIHTRCYNIYTTSTHNAYDLRRLAFSRKEIVYHLAKCRAVLTYNNKPPPLKKKPWSPISTYIVILELNRIITIYIIYARSDLSGNACRLYVCMAILVRVVIYNDIYYNV